MEKQKTALLIILALIFLLSICSVNAANLDVPSEVNMTYGENKNLTITLTENNTPSTNKTIEIRIESTGTIGKTFKIEKYETNENGQVIINLQNFSVGRHSFYIYEDYRNNVFEYSVLNVQRTNIINVSTKEVNMSYGEDNYIIISLKENGIPLVGKTVRIYESNRPYNILYPGYVKVNESFKTDSNGQIKYYLNKLITATHELRIDAIDYSSANYIQYDTVKIDVNQSIFNAKIDLKKLNNHKTQVTIQILDKNGNPIASKLLFNLFFEEYNGKRIIDSGSMILDEEFDFNYYDLETDSNGKLVKILPYWVYTGFFNLTCSYYDNYLINTRTDYSEKLPTTIKITDKWITSKYYGINYKLYAGSKKTNKQIKAVVDGKTYNGKNNILLIPIKGFKKYNAKLFFNAEGDYGKSEYLLSYTLSGKELIKSSITSSSKPVKKFKKFGHTYGKYIIYNVYQYLNGKTKKVANGYSTILISKKIFKYLTTKEFFYGYGMYLECKAYFNGDNKINVKLYSTYKNIKQKVLYGTCTLTRYTNYVECVGTSSSMKYDSFSRKKVLNLFKKYL